MAKLILDDISGTPNFYVKVNENSRRIEAVVEEAVLRTGDGPNFMEADLDMNGFNILNQRNRVALESFNWRGDWATDILYMMGDTVYIGGASYINLTEHTSDVFLDDFNLGYWDVVVQATGVLPDQTGEVGKFLQSNGINAEWTDVTTVADAAGTASTLVSNLDATLHSVAKSGNYSELNNKPTIPAAQVNSDWNASSGVAQILNKPSLDFVDRVNNQTIAGQKTFSDIIIPHSTKGIRGTITNDNADAGSIGEVLSQQVLLANEVPLVNGVGKTVMSITLTPGHWSISGQGGFDGTAASISVTRFGFSFGLVTNVFNVDNAIYLSFNPAYVTGSAGVYWIGSLMSTPYKVSVNTTIYMVFLSGFSGGGMSGYGSMTATRVR